jgi:hypothetical protein
MAVSAIDSARYIARTTIRRAALWARTATAGACALAGEELVGWVGLAGRFDLEGDSGIWNVKLA